MDINARKGISGRLFLVSAKLLAIADLIKFHSGEPSLEVEKANLGLGEILTDLAHEVDKVVRVVVGDHGEEPDPSNSSSENRTDPSR